MITLPPITPPIELTDPQMRVLKFVERYGKNNPDYPDTFLGLGVHGTEWNDHQVGHRLHNKGLLDLDHTEFEGNAIFTISEAGAAYLLSLKPKVSTRCKHTIELFEGEK